MYEILFARTNLEIRLFYTHSTTTYNYLIARFITV